MLEYHYSAFGELYNKSNDYSGLVKELFDNNIYIYKGYCYDCETGLYYCNSRYYNPEVGHIISAKDVSQLSPNSINGLNLFTYECNSPVVVSASAEPSSQTYGISEVSSIVSSVNGGRIGGGSSINLLPIPIFFDNISDVIGILTSVWHTFNVLKYIRKYDFFNETRLFGMNPVNALNKLEQCKGLKIVNGVLIGIDVLSDVYSNIQQGNSWQETTFSALATLGKDVAVAWSAGKIGGMVGGLIGRIIPIPGGMIIGYIVGTVAGIIVGFVIDDVISKGIDWVKDQLFH